MFLNLCDLFLALLKVFGTVFLLLKLFEFARHLFARLKELSQLLTLSELFFEFVNSFVHFCHLLFVVFRHTLLVVAEHRNLTIAVVVEFQLSVH